MGDIGDIKNSMSIKVFHGFIFNPEKWPDEVADIKYKISQCIDRFIFLTLFAISPDLLQLALVTELRANKKRLDLTAYELENLEELVMQAIYYIAGSTFLAPRELKAWLTVLGNQIAAITARNSAQQIINGASKW